MKRANHLMPRIIEPENLRWAFWKASKGKRYAASVLAYQQDLDENLLLLRAQIAAGRVEVGDYRYFRIYEPKEREICAAAFREQVLHHALMNVCHSHFERKQIYDSYASRKGKGTYAALERAQQYCRRYDWFLKLDVRKFFASLHHEVMEEQLSRTFKEKRLLSILDQIIDSYEASPGRGVPIGNLTSQYLANHYLCGLDHYIKEDLGVKGYVRYMDDMVLWSNEKKALLDARKSITTYLEQHLRCALKPSLLNQCRRGLPFLGYRVHPYHIRLLQKSKVRFIRKVNRILDNRRSGLWDEAVCQRRILPLLAFLSHANADNFRKNVFYRSYGQAP